MLTNNKNHCISRPFKAEKFSYQNFKIRGIFVDKEQLPQGFFQKQNKKFVKKMYQDWLSDGTVF